ncbi:TetR/AcrR family transcriptional regulator [Amycolatopsis viridis]|uniref:AcrR family transcriptional regulator n=1 Tax=Amycolatopsis viridis TaxID=185678 RepID=A0ABX0SV18_9PSEU|nr:TetR/AcrR family transcriptional regulator [Amycolatopsis viridis]NIH80816.1 AcrR family transcriptional regulator [Amycolatopsis viridis]
MATRTRRGSAKRAAGPAGGTSGSDRRDELLGIAAALFATRGYAETTVRDIADEAGILSGSLYHHFSSKEAMLDEILRGFLTDLLDRFNRIEREFEDPRQALDELIAASFQSISTTPHAVALYQNQVDTLLRQPGFEYVGECSRQVEKAWLRVLLAGQKAGVFREDVDMNLMYRFIRDTVWSTVRWYRPRGKYKPEAVAKQYLDVLYGGLLTS